MAVLDKHDDKRSEQVKMRTASGVSRRRL